MQREATKEIVTGAIGIAFAILSHFVIKYAKVNERLDDHFDAKDAKKEN